MKKGSEHYWVRRGFLGKGQACHTRGSSVGRRAKYLNPVICSGLKHPRAPASILSTSAQRARVKCGTNSVVLGATMAAGPKHPLP